MGVDGVGRLSGDRGLCCVGVGGTGVAGHRHDRLVHLVRNIVKYLSSMYSRYNAIY